MAEPGHEIDLLSCSNSVCLNAENLAKLLCRSNVANKPLAVIGIVGPARSGKSFLMSYLSRYLQSRAWVSPDDWIRDMDASRRDGFLWQGGKDPHTRGIKGWNQIFKVPDNNGEELNVLLLDTQGLFSPTMTKNDDVKLFALMTALCSTLIYNVERKIDETMLESLEFFMRYAVAVVSSQYDQQDQEARNGLLFQNLMFLVRDWPYAEEYPFGSNGGKCHVNECLMVKTHAEGNSVRRNIRSAVERIDGFMLPHPGLNVEQVDFDGSNEEVSEQFLKGITELAQFVFDPERLEARKLGDEPMTGQRLYSMLKDFDKTLRSGSILEVHNSFSVFARLAASSAIEGAYKEFQSGIKKVANSGCNPPNGVYGAQLKKCHQRYFSDTFICGDDIQEEYLQRLTLKCQEFFANIFDWSDFQTRQASNASIQALNGAWADYKMNMKEAMGLNVTPEEALARMHEKYLRIALKDIKDDVTPRAAFDLDHYRQLQDLIHNSWLELKKINVRREGLVLLYTLQEQSVVEEHEVQAQICINDLTEHFREELEKFSHLYMEEKELEQQVQRLQSEFVGIFNDKWRYEWPEIHSYRQDLLDVLESEHKDCMRCNLRNKEVLLNIMEESLFKAKAIYHDAMSNAIGNGCEPKALKNAHDQARQYVTDKLKEELSEIETTISGDIFHQLDAYIDSEYQKFSKLGSCNVKNAPVGPDPQNDINIMDHLIKAYKAMALVPVLMSQVTTKVRQMQSTIQSVTSLTKSIGRTSPTALPYVLIGVAAVAGVAAVGYCVYRWYQKRQLRRQLMLQQ